ncbi:hypothetical protein [Duganella sp. BuS-21]|uniref:hypothetical protein n=1 Tax=Duganella sp. BuS-21 TaxID=2943848 RepID=UPI0035A6E7EE
MTTITEAYGAKFDGTTATPSEIETLKRKFSTIGFPVWLEKMISEHRICGTYFSLSEEHDLSKMEVIMIWLSPSFMLEEAFEAYPGITAVRLGFLPIGECAQGTGDPYFLDLRNPNDDDPPLVRIVHEFGDAEDALFLSEGVELVAHHLSDFFRDAVVL